MKKFITAVLAAGLLMGGVALAKEIKGRVETNLPGSTVDIRISKDGQTTISGAKVTSVASPIINASITWGSFVMNLAVKTDANTQIVRLFGGRAELSEVGVGDFLSVSGTLDTTVSTPTVIARVIRDFSIQKKNASFGGTIKSIDAAAFSFVLATKERGDIKVSVSGSTKITKADAVIAFADLRAGDKIMLARGVFDTQLNTLQAIEIRIYALKIESGKTTFEGAVKSVSGATLPVVMIVAIHGNIDYAVNVPAGISILNKSNAIIPISIVAAGDNVQIFGIADSVSTTINATLIRDVSR